MFSNFISSSSISFLEKRMVFKMEQSQEIKNNYNNTLQQVIKNHTDGFQVHALMEGLITKDEACQQRIIKMIQQDKSLQNFKKYVLIEEVIRKKQDNVQNLKIEKLQNSAGGVNQIRENYDRVALSLLSDNAKEREIGLHPERKQDEINEAWNVQCKKEENDSHKENEIDEAWHIRDEQTLTGDSLKREQEKIANKLKLSDELWQKHEHRELALDDRGSSSKYDYLEGLYETGKENRQEKQRVDEGLNLILKEKGKIELKIKKAIIELDITEL